MLLSSYRLPVAALTIAGLVTLVIFGHLAISAHWAIVLTDSAHGPVAAVIGAIVYQFQPRRSQRSPLERGLIAIAVTTSLGIAIEIIQSQIGRDAELADVITDLLGAIVGAGICVCWFDETPPRRSLRYAGLLSAVIASMLIIAPVAIMGAAYLQRDRRFPLLLDGNAALGTAFIIPFWVRPEQETLPATVNPVAAGEQGLRIHTDKEEMWSLALQEFKADWRGWRMLVVELANPGDAPIELHLRVYDRPDGLANDAGYLAKTTLDGRSRTLWKIPLHDLETAAGIQRIDLGHVQGLILFSGYASHKQKLYVLKIGLE